MREERNTLNIILFVVAAFCIALLLFVIVSHHEKVVHNDCIARTEWSAASRWSDGR